MLLRPFLPQYPILPLIFPSQRFLLMVIGSIISYPTLVVRLILIMTRSYLFVNMVLRIGNMFITGNGFLKSECVLTDELMLSASLLLAMLIILYTLIYISSI